MNRAICLPTIKLKTAFMSTVDAGRLSFVDMSKTGARGCCPGGLEYQFTLRLNGGVVLQTAWLDGEDSAPFGATGTAASWSLDNFNDDLEQIVMEEMGITQMVQGYTLQVYAQIRNCEENYSDIKLIAITSGDVFFDAWHSADNETATAAWSTTTGLPWLTIAAEQQYQNINS